MRKFIIAGMAVAMLAIIPAAASADVQRCEAPITSTTMATFTALQPKDTEHQFVNVWKHDYTVKVASDGSFTGTGIVTDNGGAVAWNETITGSSDSDSISFKTVPTGAATGGATFRVTNAAFNTEVDVDDENTWQFNDIQMKISPLVFSSTTTDGLNHGQYVKAEGGGSVAAKSRRNAEELHAGRPVVSRAQRRSSGRPRPGSRRALAHARRAAFESHARTDPEQGRL